MEKDRQPIYGTDLSKSLPELIEGLRDDLVRVRGQISDIQHGLGWADRFEPVRGLLTCGIIALYYLKEEILRAQSLENLQL